MFPNFAAVIVAAAEVVSQTTKDAWTWIFAIGIGAFYLSVLVLVPLGWRDLVALLREMKGKRDSESD